MKVIEFVMFKLKPEITEEEFRVALADTDRWLASQPGFILRRHGVSASGRMDYAEWESVEAARTAADHFMTAPQTRAFKQALDPGSIAVHHFELVP